MPASRRRSCSSQSDRTRPNASRQGIVITHVDEERRIVEDLRYRSGPGRHDGHAGRHRLERWQPEAFVDRGIRQHRRSGHERTEMARVDPTDADHP